MAEPDFAPPYELPRWPFVAPPELAEGRVRRHPIVIVGAGLAGLTLACDLASRGIVTVVLDEDDTVGVRGASSRGICYAQKSLEIFERLGIHARILEKGVPGPSAAPSRAPRRSTTSTCNARACRVSRPS